MSKHMQTTPELTQCWHLLFQQLEGCSTGRAGITLIPTKCWIHLNAIKREQTEISNGAVDNDNVERAEGWEEDWIRPGLTGFVFLQGILKRAANEWDKGQDQKEKLVQHIFHLASYKVVTSCEERHDKELCFMQRWLTIGNNPEGESENDSLMRVS